MKRFFTILLLLFSVSTFAQDTLRVMHYNLLYYGKTIQWCTEVTNPVWIKDNSLAKIIKYVKPDIFTANEIKADDSVHKHILDNVLNIDGVAYYRKGAMTDNSSSNLSNGLFYNSNKLVLLSQHSIPTTVRDINFYNFYYKGIDIGTTKDTAYLTCIVMHLKAGNTTSDATERADQVNILMNYLDSQNKKANYLVMGDFNVYNGNEACFQNLVNHSNANVRFFDPVNMIGAWDNNAAYAAYHTQSTHGSYSNGCHATGGMDDRFDFILQSEKIKDGTDHYKYLSGTYKAIGQDGNHFNDSINSETNNSAPWDIINSLYTMSDHLPVKMDILVDQAHKTDNTIIFDSIFPNPVTTDLYINLNTEPHLKLEFDIINLFGKVVHTYYAETTGTSSFFDFPVGFLKQGFYLLRISDGKYKPVTRKFVKK